MLSFLKFLFQREGGATSSTQAVPPSPVAMAFALALARLIQTNNESLMRVLASTDTHRWDAINAVLKTNENASGIFYTSDRNEKSRQTNIIIGAGCLEGRFAGPLRIAAQHLASELSIPMVLRAQKRNHPTAAPFFDLMMAELSGT